MCEEKNKSGKFFLGAALGAIAGAVAGVVMAPKSGEETRKDIKNVGDKAIKDGKKAGDKFFSRFSKEDVEEKVEEVKEKVEEAKDKVEEKVERFLEIVAGSKIVVRRRDAQCEIESLTLLSIRVFLQVVIHINIVAIPLYRKNVVFAFYGRHRRKLIVIKFLTFLLVVLVAGTWTIVQGT